MNPTDSIYNDPALSSAKSAYESASNAATNAESAGYTLPDQLKSALTAKFSQNNPLVQDRESALKNYLNETTAGQLAVAPQSAGGSAPVVLNPLQQANLIQQRRSNVIAPLATANDLLAMQRGGVNDIVTSASNAYQGQVAQKQGAAKIAADRYTNILNELAAKAQEAQQARDEAFRQKQLEENIREFNVQQANKGTSTPINWEQEYQDYIASQQPQGQSAEAAGPQNVLDFFGLNPR